MKVGDVIWFEASLWFFKAEAFAVIIVHRASNLYFRFLYSLSMKQGDMMDVEWKRM